MECVSVRNKNFINARLVNSAVKNEFLIDRNRIYVYNYDVIRISRDLFLDIQKELTDNKPKAAYLTYTKTNSKLRDSYDPNKEFNKIIKLVDVRKRYVFVQVTKVARVIKDEKPFIKIIYKNVSYDEVNKQP